MPSFSKKSLKNLTGVNPEIIKVLNEAIKHIDFSVIEGVRSIERQRQLLEEDPPKTKTLNSKHLTGHAVDIAPYPIDWNDRERFVYLAGHIMGIAATMGVKLIWGGDWDGDTKSKNTRFFDGPHFELKE